MRFELPALGIGWVGLQRREVVNHLGGTGSVVVADVSAIQAIRTSA